MLPHKALAYAVPSTWNALPKLSIKQTLTYFPSLSSNGAVPMPRLTDCHSLGRHGCPCCRTDHAQDTQVNAPPPAMSLSLDSDSVSLPNCQLQGGKDPVLCFVFSVDSPKLNTMPGAQQIFQ